MQTSHTNSPTMWKQVYQEALFESDPRLLPPKVEAAQKAIENRLLAVRSGGTDRRELMELEDAKRTVYLPAFQDGRVSAQTFVLRTNIPPDSEANAVRGPPAWNFIGQCSGNI